MSANSRFTVAIHILTLLAFGEQEVLTSEYIAGSVNTNPVVIRRVLALLRAAKLVASKGGPGGGWQLLHSPRGITLRDVYRAIEEHGLFPLHSSTPNPKCPVGRNIQQALTKRFQTAQLALENDLECVSIADLVKEVASAK